MKTMLLFGAGKSATSLIRYLIDVCSAREWQLTVADTDLNLALSKIGTAPSAKAVCLDAGDTTARDALVASADIVISLLPPSLHYQVALSCLKNNRHLLTASYLDGPIRALEPAIREKGLLFLGEMGLDPGIDHMSALQMVRRIQAEGGHIRRFFSHTGGLVAPDSDNNPWRYKISWNPRNVVMAGAAGATYRENNRVVTRGYSALFEEPGQVSLSGIGTLAWYPNRDSLAYIPLYGLEEAGTFIRTTLRYPAYCRAWSAIVNAGLTDDKTPVDPTGLSYAAWSTALVPLVNTDNREQLEFLGLFGPSLVPQSARTSADILQHLLETRLAMAPADKDMIVMIHELDVEQKGKTYSARSTLVVKGEDSLHTAMARTVGLPLGIAAVLVLDGRIPLTGLHIPILPAIYEPVLEQLERQGIRFEHSVTPHATPPNTPS
ncbi:MAG TPA: saccharopine dehydrogenase C-terminal domain-containing protein [Puia sp.]|jgi:saccharopine dehydrogenase-like NADP-dependent oxidoreductase|nr:saccharopine dehydrogenase C-terminal domain-containing protein [Puia sp.]